MDIEITARGLFAAIFTVLVAGVPLAIFYLERRKQARPAASQPLPLPPATEIVSLRIYPIKSCRGIDVASAKLLRTGLDLDRQWMFVDAAEHQFQTIRQISRMTLINTAIDAARDELVVSIAANNSDNNNSNDGPQPALRVPAHPSPSWLASNTTPCTVSIWGETVAAHAYPAELTAPISAFLGRDVLLVLKGGAPRVLRGNGAPRLLGRTEATKFADLAPVQVASARSLAELNARLAARGERPITEERFRPNIVVAGSDAWAEDSWKTVVVAPRRGGDGASGSSGSGIVMDVMARCARCQVPNVDPDTAEKHRRQPWDTLMSYRRIDRGITFKPCFGMLCAPRAEGAISVGDGFEVTEVTADHFYQKGM